MQPIAASLIDSKAVLGTLSDLCAGRPQGRRNPDEITIFRAVGTALSDIAAGALVYRNAAGIPSMPRR